MDSKGRIRQAPFRALRDLFREIVADKTPSEAPAVYYISDALAARGNPQAGFMNAAIYDIASDVAVRWIPKGGESLIDPRMPVLTWNGNTTPANERLSQLLHNIPKVDAPGRETWRRAVVDAIVNRNQDH